MYVLIPLAGVAAGFINTLAGSGSLITLPLLIVAGLPPTVANGTNRVAILLASGVALRGFKGSGVLDVRGGLRLAPAAIVGAILGALIGTTINETAMKLAIAGLMIVMLAVLMVRPRRWLEGRTGAVTRFGWGQVAVFFAIGVYGGFIQAGVGVFLLAGLVLSAGYDLVRANAIKVLIVLCCTAFALCVFIWHDKVNWPVGLLLATGNMTGAWIATKTAIRKGAGFIRWLLIGVVTVAAGKLLYDSIVLIAT